MTLNSKTMVTLILRRVRELKARKKKELYVSFRNGFRPVTFRAFLSLHHSPTPEKKGLSGDNNESEYFLEEHFHSKVYRDRYVNIHRPSGS